MKENAANILREVLNLNSLFCIKNLDSAYQMRKANWRHDNTSFDSVYDVFQFIKTNKPNDVVLDFALHGAEDEDESEENCETSISGFSSFEDIDSGIERFCPSKKKDDNDSILYRIFYAKTVIAVWLDLFFRECEIDVSHIDERETLVKWLCKSELQLNDKFAYSLADIIRSNNNSRLPVKRIYRELSWIISDYLDNRIDSTTKDQLSFWRQWFVFLSRMEYPEIPPHEVEIEATSKLAHYLSVALKNRKRYEEGLLFAKHSLNLLGCEDRYNAFNILSLIATRVYGKRQLAYDILKSWLQMHSIGEVTNYLAEDMFAKWVIEEEKWRQTIDGMIASSVMYNNFASVAINIRDTYDLSDPAHDEFGKIAVSAAKSATDAIKKSQKILDEKNRRNKSLVTAGLYYCFQTQGRALSDLARLNSAGTLSAFQRSAKHAPDRFKQKSLMYVLSTIQTAMVFDKLYHTVKTNKIDDEKKEKIFEKCICDLYSLDSVENGDGDNYGNSVRERMKPIYQFDKIVNAYKEKVDEHKIKDISRLLVLIYQCAEIIKVFLGIRNSSKDYYKRENDDAGKDCVIHRRKDNPVAYYTTIKTASYIFDEIVQKEPGKAPTVEKDTVGKNCLTVVHAKNMNDPHEGISLLNAFQHSIKSDNVLLPPGEEVQFREALYLDTYVFLKSFTEQIDKLVMWNRYASDYGSDGQNSNGCCIEFEPEVFDRLSDPSGNREIDSDDRSSLYRVVYLSDNFTIEDSRNTSLDSVQKVRELFLFLLDRVNDLNSAIQDSIHRISDENNKQFFITTVKNALRISLETIMFLFKDDDYSEEHESRLIFSRGYDQGDSIRVLPGSPQKLAINPFFQVYIKRIILGPNVRDPDAWKPYFQYQLNKMWAKYEADTKIPEWQRYTIENSKIHYHT